MTSREKTPDMRLVNDLTPEEVDAENREARARALRVDRWLHRNRSIVRRKKVDDGGGEHTSDLSPKTR